MAHGDGITVTPLPIENPATIPNYQMDFNFIVCPICGLFYVCNNIMISSCGFFTVFLHGHILGKQS
jgi:hypothetical protein